MARRASASPRQHNHGEQYPAEEAAEGNQAAPSTPTRMPHPLLFAARDSPPVPPRLTAHKSLSRCSHSKRSCRTTREGPRALSD
jgi:hypothetical protein